MEWRDEIEEKSEMGLNEFVLWWVKGGTAARQPAKKKDERAAEATLHFFSNSWRNEKNWRKEDWRNDGNGAAQVRLNLLVG